MAWERALESGVVRQHLGNTGRLYQIPRCFLSVVFVHRAQQTWTLLITILCPRANGTGDPQRAPSPSLTILSLSCPGKAGTRVRPENSRARPIQGSFTSHGALGLKGLEPAADRPASSASASLFFLKRSQQFSNPGKGANEAKGSRGCCCPSATEYPRGVVHQAGASLAWTRGHGHCQGRVCWFQTLQRPHASTQPFQPRPPRFCPLGRLRECGPQCPGCRAAPSPSQGAHRPAFPPQAHTALPRSPGTERTLELQKGS